MHGNVFEWCLERYSSSGSGRVLRGGCWFNDAVYCTSSYRSSYYPSYGDRSIGFRLVRTLSNDFESERSAEAAAGAERAGTVCAGVSPQVEILPAYTVTVVDGSTTNSSAKVGSTVTITAGELDFGYAFVQWTSNDGVDFANASAAETTFTMPAKDVTVTAVRSEILIKDLNDAGYPWTGKPVEPEIKVELKDVDIAVRRGTDYEVSYTSNTNAGTATLTVTMLPRGWEARAPCSRYSRSPSSPTSQRRRAIRGTGRWTSRSSRAGTGRACPTGTSRSSPSWRRTT